MNGAKSQEEATILIVDDTAENIDILGEILQPDYQVKIATSGNRALEIAWGDDPPDLILLDIMMPALDGYEVCRQLKSSGLSRAIPVIFVTAMDQTINEQLGFEMGAVDFIAKPVSPPIVRARVRTHLALYRQQRELEKRVAEKTGKLNEALEGLRHSALETIYRLTQAAEYRDEDTGEHIQRMSRFASLLAGKLGLNSNTCEWILYAAPMHDVGKIGIPDRILLKPDKLTAAEWEIMQQHTTIGARILSGSKEGYIRLGEIIALTHHEKWDGSGYPRGLKGKEIPLVGQIVAAADVFDALTSKRPYKEPFPIEHAFAIIRESRGTHFKPGIVDAILDSRDEIVSIKSRYRDSGASFLHRLNSTTG